MSLDTTVRPPAVAPLRPADPRLKVTGPRVLRAEWAKLWSLRSTWITLGLGLLFLIAFGVIGALRYKSMAGAGQTMDPDFADATALSLAQFGVPFAMIAFGVLGVLTTAGEYSTGMIRSTLAAVPRRLPVLWSKAAVYGVVVFVAGLLGAVVAFAAAGAVVSGTKAAMSLGDAGVLRSLAGSALYLGLAGIAGVALGAVLRSTAGGISTLVGTFLLLPGLMSLLPSSWQAHTTQYLPSNAGQSIYALHHSAGTLTAGAGLLVLVGWTVLALGSAAYRLRRSDA